MPPDTISVTRPGKFGNPIRVGEYVKIGNGPSGWALIRTTKEYATPEYTYVDSAATAVRLYEEYRAAYPLTESEKEELRRKNLACFCPLGSPCHADVLLKLANT